ncbi:hypothetical protein FM104_02985 [Microbacterium esteraromaticum]|uniref:Uncharacterized protein n=1 Tax=Microbacterium esteraromaticum TaxID=57043 RepID=A0A1R4IMN8_9MICO|nr:hypothetical protein FM104_02985 [Microbacterium esteraromaticum]
MQPLFETGVERHRKAPSLRDRVVAGLRFGSEVAGLRFGSGFQVRLFG